MNKSDLPGLHTGVVIEVTPPVLPPSLKGIGIKNFVLFSEHKITEDTRERVKEFRKLGYKVSAYNATVKRTSSPTLGASFVEVVQRRENVDI